MAIEFAILGPLEVVAGGKAVELGGAKQRAVLADLLIHANQLVTADRLIEDLWGERAPRTASNVIQVHVSAIRRAIGRHAVRPESVLVTRSSGYMLRLGPEELDATRFETRASQGRAVLEGDPAAAATVLEQALALWRGSPLPEFSFESFAQPEITRLEELKLSVSEDWIAANLSLGNHSRVVGELRRLVAEHPLRERLREYLMLSLYRSGRQAEALEAYRHTREILAEELGIDPSPALQRLEQAILAHDRSLDLTEPRMSPRLVQAADMPELSVDRPVHEVRKLVTMVFVDAMASTTEGHRVDAEVARTVMKPYLHTVSSVVERHGGMVERTVGDAVVAVFGLPLVHEDDPSRALRAATEMVDAVEMFNRQLLSSTHAMIGIRAAILTGEVMVREPATGRGLESGDLLSEVARIGHQAELGEILLGDSTHRLVRNSVDVEAVPLSLGGPTSPVLAFRLLGMRRAGDRGPSLGSPMVGRDLELRLLERALDRVAADRSAQLVTIVGAAGVGKSRLVSEFLTQAGTSAHVVRGRCLSYGEGITFWPLAEIVKEAAGVLDTDPPEQAIGKLASLLSGAPRGQRAAVVISSIAGMSKETVSPEEGPWAVRIFLASLARHRPVVVAIDDIHWAEQAFLDMLEDIAARIQDAPLLLLCMARPDLLERRPGWLTPRSNTSTVLLEALDADQSAALVGHLLGEAPVPVAITAPVLSAAEGNPLFVQELLAMLIEEGVIWSDADGVWFASEAITHIAMPSTIQILLSARLDTLDGNDRAVAQRASVEGQLFHSGAVSYLSPDQDRPGLPARLFTLVRKDLIRPDTARFAGEVAFQFRHLLIRDAAYAGLLKEHRAELHERFAEWLTNRAGVRLPEYEEIVGYHLETAFVYRSELGLVDEHSAVLARRAGERLGSAGRRAMRRGDVAAATKLLERTLRLLPDDHPERLDTMLEQVAALRQARLLEAVEPIVNEALERARATGDPRLVWRATYELLETYIGEDPWTYEEAERQATEAIPVLMDLGDDLALERAWQLLALVAWDTGSAEQAEEAQTRALEYARRAGDSRGVAEIAAGLPGIAEEGPATFAHAIQLVEEVLPDVQDHLKSKGYVLGALASLLAKQGRFDEARAAVAEANQAFREGGVDQWLVQMHWTAAFIEFLAGDLEAADLECRVGLSLADTAHGRKYTDALVSTLFIEVAHGRGRIEDAAPYVSRALSASAEARPYRAEGLCAVSLVAWARGDLSEAERLVREAMALLEPTDDLNRKGFALLRLAELLERANRTAEASATAGEAARLFDRKGNVVLGRKARLLHERLARTVLAT